MRVRSGSTSTCEYLLAPSSHANWRGSPLPKPWCSVAMPIFLLLCSLKVSLISLPSYYLPDSCSSLVPTVCSHPLKEPTFRLSAPQPSTHQGRGNREAVDPEGWSPLGYLYPKPTASSLWEERYNQQGSFLFKKQGGKRHESTNYKIFPFFPQSLSFLACHGLFYLLFDVVLSKKKYKF